MRFRLLAGCLCVLLANGASAAAITYTATSQGGNRWQYEYFVASEPGAGTIAEFTVHFALGSYANLLVAGSPAGWDSLVVQPDAAIPDDGYFDALALAAGIAPGAGLGGFAVSFDYLGAGTPGPQAFDIVDPATFASIAPGTTTAVPAPPAGWLLATAVAIAVRRRRSRAA
jgi:hypothetical protein